MKFMILFAIAFLFWSCSDKSSGPDEEVLSSNSQLPISSGTILSSSESILGSSLNSSSSSNAVVNSSSITMSSSAIQYPVAPQAADWCAAAEGNCGTYVDTRDNRTYKWTKIASQTWMAENLKYTGSETGTRVGKCPGIVGPDSTGDHESCETYGRQYTWYELNKTTYLANEDPQGICPDGWQVPRAQDWTNLGENLRTLNSLPWSSGTSHLLKATNTGNNSWDNAKYNAGNPYQFSLMPPETGDYLFVWTRSENAVSYGQGKGFSAKTDESITDMTQTKNKYGFARCIKANP